MVKTAEADVVCGAVAGDNPLRACHEEALEFKDALAYVASASLAERHELVGYLAGDAGAVAAFKPLGGESLDFFAAVGAGRGLRHKVGKTLAHLFRGNLHAETEFGEVLEERVGPCRTVACGVGRVRSRGHGT